jgi:formiminoglutamate deiminase
LGKLFFDNVLLLEGWAKDVLIEIDDDGRIARIAKNEKVVAGVERAAIGLPGLPNLHSHAFQRGMAGLAEVAGGDADSFWTWRQVMYRFLDKLTPDDVEAIATQLYIEMLEAGFTSVAEFHYLHNSPDGSRYSDPAEIAGRIVNAAAVTGIGLTLLPVYYGNGGFGGQPLQAQQRRFGSRNRESFAALLIGANSHAKRQSTIKMGIAPHSLRAVTPEALGDILPLAGDGPVHIHVAEQTKEVEDCLSWSGKRPVSWLLDNADVGPSWCLIHATHMEPPESEALAATNAVIGLCPQTEANLGDGIFDGRTYLGAGGRFGIGTDSHIRVDVAEELRTLEYGQRLRDRRRNVLAHAGGSTGRRLYEAAVAGGAQALGRPSAGLAIGQLADIVVLDSRHSNLAGHKEDQLLDGWLFAGDGRCIDSVWVAGRKLVAEGRHGSRTAVAARFAMTMERLLA